MLRTAAPRPLTILKTRSQPIEPKNLIMGAVAATLVAAIFSLWLAAPMQPINSSSMLRVVQHTTLS